MAEAKAAAVVATFEPAPPARHAWAIHPHTGRTVLVESTDPLARRTVRHEWLSGSAAATTTIDREGRVAGRATHHNLARGQWPGRPADT